MKVLVIAERMCYNNFVTASERARFFASNSPYQTADYQDRAAEAVTSPRTPGSRHFDSGD